MATSSEKRALLFLAALAALGVSVRAFRAPPGAAGRDASALDRQIAAVDSANRVRDSRGRSGAPAKSRKARTPQRETADARDDRRASPQGPGGAAAAPGAAPLARYEERRRAVDASNGAARERLRELAEVTRVTPQPPPSGSPPSRDRAAVDLDTADEVAIASVPWIGEALAARIVADRTRRGAFGSLEGLERVPGIGPAMANRIARYVRFSGSAMRRPTITRLPKPRS